MQFAEIILHRRVPSRFASFTYEIPKDLALTLGQLVRVPFRKQKLSGVVRSLHENTPRYPTKCIEAAFPLVLAPWQMELANWMSEKYKTPLANVMNLFIPENIWLGKVKNQRSKVKGEMENGKWKMEGQKLLLFPELFSLQKFETGVPVFHGTLKESEKARIWNDVREGKISIIAGTRAALFLPFQKLSSITLHFEENENYRERRQPTYHAFEVAERLSRIWEIPLTIVSASPRVETWWKCQMSNVKCQMLPGKKAAVEIIDMREERKKGNYGVFAESVLEKIASTLTQNHQILIFINRRGSASALLCQECHTVFRCGKCSSPLTLHSNNELRCHRCRIKKPVPTQCSLCHSLRLKPLGTGTEGLEKEMKKIFGKAKILRLDREILKREKVAQPRLGSNEVASLRLGLDEKNLTAADIIVATQIIDKPLDLPRLKLAVVPAADPLFSYPDFRAQEHAFQLFTHLRYLAVSGKLILQTYLPEHPLFQYLQKNLTEKFYEDELETRKSLSLPPFTPPLRPGV